VSFAAALILLAAPLDAGLEHRDAGPIALPPLPFVWELPPNTVSEVPIDGTTYVIGVPVRMRYLMVKSKPADIGRHFLESFKRQGLFVDTGQDASRMFTAVDPQSFNAYTVVLQPNGPDHTTVIIGESKPLQRNSNDAGGLPLPPSARNVLPVKFEGYTVTAFSVPDALSDVQSFYALELSRRGYQPKSDTLWLKRGEQLDVKLSTKNGRTNVVLEQRALALP
jgi:hypothetical protein